jgi:esterase/lipase
VLFIHGFSATGAELRPLPEMVAQGLGANLYLTRLTGHGQDGDAMATATLAAWRADVDEAITIAQTIGECVMIMGCSTGCTLGTLALAEGASAAGIAMISPNFGLRHTSAQMALDLPGVRHWGHLVAGRQRSFPVLSDAHARYWTTSYPTAAVYPMADAVRAVRRADLRQIKAAGLFAVNPDDQVISPAAVRRVMARWGGPVSDVPLVQGPTDDPMGHVMAGDVFSPAQTAPLARRILDWAATL